MPSEDFSPRSAMAGYPCPWLWEREGADWPLREASHRVRCAGLDWHVQRLGQGHGRSTVLLLHGTFSSTHSWRGLAPRLAAHYDVLMPDLPGHGWTFGASPEDMAMRAMSAKLLALLDALGVHPEWVIGHSAGAALAVSMALLQHRGPAPPPREAWAPSGQERQHTRSADADSFAEPAPGSPPATPAPAGPRLQRVVSLNGALLPLAGLGGRIYAPAAQVLQRLPGLARLTAWGSARSDVVARLLDNTGSRLAAQDIGWYQRLATDAGHVAAVVEMMARWDLEGFAQHLPGYQDRLELVAGSRDATVPPSELRRVLDLVPQARCRVLRDLGHLAHEEDPDTVGALLLELLAR